MLEANSSRKSNVNDHPFNKIDDLRAAIDAKLHERGIYEQIRELVNAKASKVSIDENENQPNSEEKIFNSETADSKEEQVIHEVLESELVQQLLLKLRSMEFAAPEKLIEQSDESAVGVEDTREVVLYLRLSEGKAFVDQMVDFEHNDGNTNEEVELGLKDNRCPVGSVVAFFRVNASFQKQRQSSHDIQCCVDPTFDAHFRFHVKKRKSRTARSRDRSHFAVDVMSPWEALCFIEEPVQLDLVKVRKRFLRRDDNGIAIWQELSRELIAVHRLDWRRILCSTLEFVHFPIQLTGRMKEPVGTLDLRANLLNCKRTASIAREVRSFLNKEALQRNASNHTFFKYAKQWWEDYRNETREDINGPDDGSVDEHVQSLAKIDFRQRLVKMFAEDEEGRYRMMCKFIVPLRARKAVRSPSEAARFVCLLPYESNSLAGGGNDEPWRSIPTILSTRKGNAQDHAILLASLLLGCGLDAYICIGTISACKSASRFTRGSQDSNDDRGLAEVGHVWVLTRGTCTSDVFLWEAVTGEKFCVHDARAPKRRGYCAIDCVFNHRRYFANLQPRACKLAESSFDFDDETCWKCMDENLIADLPFKQPQTALLPPDVISASRQEDEWTVILQRAIASRRRDDGFMTVWSDELSFYLLPALNSYELERLYEVTQVDNIFFRQSVSNFVQEGYTFQGVPLVFTFESPDEALDIFMSNTLVSDILTIHARSAQFAIAVRCFPYAEHTVATWVMLAVSYPSKN
ncbi:putative CEP76, C2 domain-containing protein [Plasmopara halstedii]